MLLVIAKVHTEHFLIHICYLIMLLCQSLMEYPYKFLLLNLYTIKHFLHQIIAITNQNGQVTITRFAQYSSRLLVQMSPNSIFHMFVYNIFPPVFLYISRLCHLLYILFKNEFASYRFFAFK